MLEVAFYSLRVLLQFAHVAYNSVLELFDISSRRSRSNAMFQIIVEVFVRVYLANMMANNRPLSCPYVALTNHVQDAHDEL